MLLGSVILAFAIAYFATQISNKQAADYIYGKRKGPNVTPGSGEFFDGIAQRYDLLNQIISLGHHASWKRAAMDTILPAESVLDVSTGTADIAIAIAMNRSVRVVGVDPSKEMLAMGRKKIAQAGQMIGPVELVEGVAEALPFEDETFHAVIVAFGVRNFQNRTQGLGEMARVLKPGGRMAIVELSLPNGDGIMDKLTRFFVNRVVPKLAALVSGNEAAYQYLSDSMAAFPDKEEFAKMLVTAGVEVEAHKRLPPLGMGPDLYLAAKAKQDGEMGA